MQYTRKKIVIIGGITGTGKSNLAIELARQFNGELINCDSRQFYSEMNIGTNKDPLVEIEGSFYTSGIPIHLVNIIKPNEYYDLYRFKEVATQKIKEILSQNKLPVLVGGSGLYIDSIVKNYSLETNQEYERKESLEHKGLEELQDMVKKIVNVELINASDWKNPRRLINIIARGGINHKRVDPEFDNIILYKNYVWSELIDSLNLRVEEMFKKGLVEETRKLLELGYSITDPGLKVMGYKECVEFILKKESIQNTIENVKKSHREYAKKQRTWFEGQRRGYDLKFFKDEPEAIELCKNFLKG